MNQRIVNNNGIGFCGLLTIVFVLLKVFEVVSWSWWVVFSPVLVGFGLSIVVIIIVMILMGISIVNN